MYKTQNLTKTFYAFEYPSIPTVLDISVFKYNDSKKQYGAELSDLFFFQPLTQRAFPEGRGTQRPPPSPDGLGVSDRQRRAYGG